MKIKAYREDVLAYLREHNLLKKWDKAIHFFETNMRHPSLHTELLEPHWQGIYSFRIDRHYRALFFIDEEIIEVFKITKHYKK